MHLSSGVTLTATRSLRPIRLFPLNYDVEFVCASIDVMFGRVFRTGLRVPQRTSDEAHLRRDGRSIQLRRVITTPDIKNTATNGVGHVLEAYMLHSTRVVYLKLTVDRSAPAVGRIPQSKNSPRGTPDDTHTTPLVPFCNCRRKSRLALVRVRDSLV